jgi:(1->4)-alpha-D-glucan 1-alpha-D-glucosylmutase
MPSLPAVKTRELSVEAFAERLFEAESRAAAESPLRRPGATYRVQMHRGFRLEDLNAIVDYLADLGVTDCYMSPYLLAKPGSTHGYDVFDHGQINPEIGNEDDHARLIARLRTRGMGRVLDIVPNHMGIAGANRFWLEVLETGPAAPSARFFDIDWHPVKEELENRILLPILEDQYGRVLEQGQLALERDGGAFFIRYHDQSLPLAPQSYARVLERRAHELQANYDPDDENVLEYRSIWSSAHNLPERNATDPEQVEHVLREKEVLKRRIARLCAVAPRLRDFIDESVASFRGSPGDPATFDALHALLEEQVYRLAYWRVAADEINYRRFFDINDLAGLRTEDSFVFEVGHRLLLRWIDEGNITGIRIDHPDGLADPLGYLRRLQEVVFMLRCKSRFDAEPTTLDWSLVANEIRRRYRVSIREEPSGALARRFPIVVEKILSRGEELPADWPVDGTVGYEFLNVLNGLFVEPSAADAIDCTYREFTGDDEPFSEVLYQAKQHITRTALSSELNMLGRQLNRISEGDRCSRDFTLNELRRALRDVIAQFPVYRTYMQLNQPVADRDREYVDQAVSRAQHRDRTVDASLFAFLRDALLLEHPPRVAPAEKALREAFVIRFQQTTGPVQAKGLEDTAFYRQPKLASLCEVGSDPGRFSSSPSTFHGLNTQRLRQWPGSLATTCTHDTKRGEDARTRINVLSELADEWKVHLTRWSRWHARKKVVVNDVPAPDSREEYLLYQTLIGSWPVEVTAENIPPSYVERIQHYTIKAAREAKLNTSWIDSDPTYTETLARFVSEILVGPDSGPFLKDFIPFQRKIARVGVVHSLAQCVLRLASPGVPDIYQGSELWDLSLVDPDNRRPVDYGLRSRLLETIRSQLAEARSRAELATELFHSSENGAIKLYLIWRILSHRRANSALYTEGAYRPLEIEGDLKTHVIAFLRAREGKSVIAIAPRCVASLMGETAETAPVGTEVWSDTRIILPETSHTKHWRDLLTGRPVSEERADGRIRLSVANAFAVLPIALLVEE